MRLTIVEPRASETDGLVSGYQRTSVTSSGISAVSDTGGSLLVGVAMIPRFEPLLGVEPLATQMQQSIDFLGIVQRGLADVQQGRYTRIEELKRKLGDI